MSYRGRFVMTNAGIFRHKEPHQRKVPKIQSGTIDRGRGGLSFLKPYFKIAVANDKFFGL